MQLPRQILVATDFSDVSRAALEYAIGLAKDLGAKITVVHVFQVPVFAFPNTAMSPTLEMTSSIMTSAQAATDAVCAEYAGRGVEMKPAVCEGVASTEIHRIADEVRADLIVVGTHGRQGLAHALLGSVAEKIIRTATRPILTIHGPHGT